MYSHCVVHSRVRVSGLSLTGAIVPGLFRCLSVQVSSLSALHQPGGRRRWVVAPGQGRRLSSTEGIIPYLAMPVKDMSKFNLLQTKDLHDLLILEYIPHMALYSF